MDQPSNPGAQENDSTNYVPLSTKPAQEPSGGAQDQANLPNDIGQAEDEAPDTNSPASTMSNESSSAPSGGANLMGN